MWHLWIKSQWIWEVIKIEPKDYIVSRIDGDYAHLANVETGENLLVARALLPEEISEGSRLHWEMFEYSIVE